MDNTELERWLCPLTKLLARVLESVLGPLSQDQLMEVEDSVHSHGLDGDNPPSWMTKLLQTLVDGVLTGRVSIPDGYPEGENGLTNVLADVGDQLLGIEDVGESLVWTLPRLGVVLQIQRESGTPTYEVLPHKLEGAQRRSEPTR